MNVFYLHHDPKICASMHVDKHVVKMILEYAQLLSTTHRVLDGIHQDIVYSSGRKGKRWILPDSRDEHLYQATHINHPSAIWTRACKDNYLWLYDMFTALMSEYTYRYNKTHACEKLIIPLKQLPNNINNLITFFEPTPAMPDEYIAPNDSIQSYKNYYNGKKTKLFVWTKRPVPDFVLYQVSA